MKNLKPFNLKEALAGKAVMLRSGTKAYVRHYETEIEAYSGFTLLGIAENGVIRAWRKCGHIHPATEDTMDIIGMYPETRMINGYEVPTPEAKKPAHNSTYYIPSLSRESFRSVIVWSDCDADLIWLERGLVFLNEEDAIANAKAMLDIDPNSEDEL